MQSINGSNITLTRGDSLFINLELTKNGEAYVPEEGAVIRFAMKHKYTDPDVLILKYIPIDTLTLELVPEDTKNLAFRCTYVYDIELTEPGGNVYTFLKGTLTLSEEVC